MSERGPLSSGHDNLPDPMPEDPSERKSIEVLLERMRQKEAFDSLTDNEKAEKMEAIQMEAISAELEDGVSPAQILKDLGGHDQVARLIGESAADDLMKRAEEEQGMSSAENTEILHEEGEK